MRIPTTHVFNVYRLSTTGVNEEYSGTPVYTGVDAAVLPASTDVLAVFGGSPSYQLYEIFIFEYVDLKVGDKLIQSGETYIVQDSPQVVNIPYFFYVRVVGQKAV
jgi:hypothetical protein